ncbi:NAD-dependent epimerase/dehydratase family protein [Bacillus sp. Bva_UNVM-123]|uniref:SDR family oxidoreductase n=1 Tax=Bacillus sp. Bva_UNVM-123 TaxID=2829798 RepID=UPI00391F7517
MNNELHVIVGTGPLGIALMEELKKRNKQVRMVNRSGQANISVEVVKGDATSYESILQACTGASVIYHCAKPPYSQWPEKFPPITKGLVEAASAINAKFVYADNLYMYGPTEGVLTENLKYNATDQKGKTRAEMAEYVMEAHKNGRVRATIGRASDFYGPGVLESSLGIQVVKPAIEGKTASFLGKMDLPHTYTYIHDFARGLATLGDREEALGEVWHIPSAETLTTKQMMSLIYKEVNREPKYRVASRGLVSLIGLFNSSMRELKDTFYQNETPFIVDHRKYEKVFGSEVTPHEKAIKETVEWYKKYLAM